MKVKIFYNPIKEGAQARANELTQLLIGKGIDTGIKKTARKSSEWSMTDTDVSLVVIFGGDGSFLSTARHILPYKIPILGINYGRLGFLSEYGDMCMEELSKLIKNDQIDIESRTVLEARLPNQERTFVGINDIAINRSHHSNLLYTDLYVDDNLLHSFRSDGIIISTPTGSTAYALSAGGAVMDPNIRAFEIVPVAAHSLTSRPHVISDEQTIVIVSKDSKKFFMQADGQEIVSLDPGTKIIVRKSPHQLLLAKLRGKSKNFYSVLRDKMKWGFAAN